MDIDELKRAGDADALLECQRVHLAATDPPGVEEAGHGVAAQDLEEPQAPLGLQPPGRGRNHKSSSQSDRDRILVREIEEALHSAQAEIIEDYPSDPRGPSFLLLGFTETGMPIHAVCALTDALVIITLYGPDPSRWIEWRRRREA